MTRTCDGCGHDLDRAGDDAEDGWGHYVCPGCGAGPYRLPDAA